MKDVYTITDGFREKRNKKIKRILEKNPTISLKELGFKIGVSRERARQILVKLDIKKENASTARSLPRIKKKCAYANCNKELIILRGSKNVSKNRKYCSYAHWNKVRQEKATSRKKKWCNDCKRYRTTQKFTTRLLKGTGTVSSIGFCRDCMTRRSRIWQSKNKDKVKVYVRRYYMKNRESRIESSKEYRKEYYLKNKEKILEKNRRYYLKNKEAISRKQKERYQRNKHSK
jgi:hypothetical protein